MASLDNHYKSYIAYNMDRLTCVNKWAMPIKMGVVGDGRISKFLVIKTHGSVSCGPRSRRATPEYINRKKENAIFTPM